MHEPSPSAWYKQFWPWFLITIPVVSIILSVTMLNLAINTENSMVIDDYYKEGKAINLQLERVEEAKSRNILTELYSSGTNLTLTFLSGQPESGAALKLLFSHATLESKDFDVLLSQDANGVYRAQLVVPLTGKWNLTLTPLNQQWKISQPMAFPRDQAVLFKP